MKIKSALTSSVFALLLSATAALAATDELPKTQSFTRYDAMMKRSPFAVATAAVPPPQTPNFAKDLYIANAARLENESVVTLVSSTDKNFKEYLSTSGPNKSGYGISNIDWSDRIGGTKVTISKDGQFAPLTFNQALMSQPVPTIPLPQPVQPMTQAVQNFMPPPANGVNTIRPAPIPTLPTPPPRVRPVIPRTPPERPVQHQPEPNSGVVPDEP